MLFYVNQKKSLFVINTQKEELSKQNRVLSKYNAEINIETDVDRVRPDDSEVERLVCNNNKLIQNTAWQPDYNLDKGLMETIDWIKNNMDNYKPDIYNV